MPNGHAANVLAARAAAAAVLGEGDVREFSSAPDNLVAALAGCGEYGLMYVLLVAFDYQLPRQTGGTLLVGDVLTRVAPALAASARAHMRCEIDRVFAREGWGDPAVHPDWGRVLRALDETPDAPDGVAPPAPGALPDLPPVPWDARTFIENAQACRALDLALPPAAVDRLLALTTHLLDVEEARVR